jgi:IS30 family transposase
MEQQNQVQWRREKVQELCSKGYSQREISQMLQVGLATLNRDVSYLRNQAKTNIKKYRRKTARKKKVLQVDISMISRDVYFLRQQAKTNIKKYIDERLPEEYEKCLVGLNAITREAWNTAQNTEDKREKIQALSLAKECYSMKLDLLTNATVVEDAIRFVSQKSHGKKEEKTGEITSSTHHQIRFTNLAF